MKKIFFTFALLLIAGQFAMAGITEGRSSDVDFLLKTNYSESTAKIVDTIKARNNYDEDYHYERVYKRNYPQDGKEYTGAVYSRIKAWVDPMADDHYFGEHEVNFDNKFFQMEPSFRDFLRGESRETKIEAIQNNYGSNNSSNYSRQNKYGHYNSDL